jgi:hypothetical protein
MPSGGDVIELVHEQTYLGQICNNVYYFEAVDGTALLNVLAAWFETNVVPTVKALQVDLVTHTNLRLRNLFNLAETYEEPLTGVGGVTSAALELPSFIAYGVRFDHNNGEVRSGFKRITGCEEGGIADGLLTPARVTTLETYANVLVNPLTPALATWAHVVINRVCEELNPVVGGIPRCLEYRLPNAQIESNPGYPVSYEVYTQPTSQNSRKWYT